ncbi:MAG TPA: DNA topoisomerase IV subunit A, partial [Hyphomicrobiales bacterium]|nr:DNA topoisomerase IV subunit A [Hyphomicrobiales bacterium]
TYDGEESEPVVLPAAAPNLLANGASGIAVGMATSIPPHNLGELADAALHLIKYPNAGLAKLVELVPGPDFPTGGVIVDSRETVLEAYRTGRGAFRLRARWNKEDTGRGTYVVVVDEIPYQVQKSKLIEKIAELLQARKLPLLADVRDESAEDVRLVLEPKNRGVDPVILMESLFRATDLETRVPLNMNVLSRGRVPKVMNLKEVLAEWLDHRKEVLLRRTRFRLGKIAHRLTVLNGYLIAYLNLDEVIRIIRNEDEPKPELMRAFGLSDVQAEAILNMRLRALRKLEEMEIRREHGELSAERDELEALAASEDRQWAKITAEIKDLKKRFGGDDELGRRRSAFADAPEAAEVDAVEAMIEREPVTVVFSEKGWIRALRGHIADTSQVPFKSGDRLKFAAHAQTTDRIVLFATNGKFYTLDAGRLPGGRGHGEPVRLMIELDDTQDIVALFVHKPGRKLLVAASDGRGFITPEDEVVAMTRKGKQVLNVKTPVEAAVSAAAEGDHVAVIGDNRKLLIFPRAELPEMPRGKGVRLQRYRQGGLSDAKLFTLADGLTWRDSSDRTWTVKASELKEWIGARAQAGRLSPKGFPRSNKFA